MEMILTQIHWLAVLLSTLAAFMIGALWYSKFLFMKKWKEGIGQLAVTEEAYKGPHMYFGMITQFVSTAFFAFLVSTFIILNQPWLIVLTAITLMGFTKATGFYAGKTKTAISIEVGYVFIMMIVLYLVQTIFY